VRIDAHQHFWRIARGDYGWLSPSTAPILYRDYDPLDLYLPLVKASVSGSIVVQAAPTSAETLFLRGFARRVRWIKGVVGWTDFDAPDAPARIRDLGRWPDMLGLRPMLQDLADPRWILDKSRAPALRAMVDAGLVFDALVRAPQLSVVAELADRHPDLAVVLDHAGKPPIGDRKSYPQWAIDIANLARRPNVSCKLSGLLTEAPQGVAIGSLRPYVDTLLQGFGEDRLMWGSDWPVLLLASDYAAWSELSDRLLEEYGAKAVDKVRGANAVRIYKLAATSPDRCAKETEA
jgi:L-fuconolactonase